MMTPEERARAVTWVRDHMQRTICTSCNGQSWHVEDTYLLPQAVLATGLPVEGHGVLVLLVACDVCGVIRFFDTRKLRLHG